ncbi:MAG: GFA family protein [Sandaracinus sp.]
MTRYHGSCHCGAVQFDVEGLDLENAATCNCSICGRTGALMLFVPEGKLENVVGRETMTDYQFGKKRTHHAFCATCGIRPFAWGPGHDGAEWAMVNVRCLDGVNVHDVEVKKDKRYDGRAL